jgi:hypothetical protein
MATLPSADDKLRQVLDIYQHFGTRPGEGLFTQNFMAIAAKRGLRMTDIADGMELGVKLGYFDQGQNNVLILTEAGFAAI